MVGRFFRTNAARRARPKLRYSCSWPAGDLAFCWLRFSTCDGRSLKMLLWHLEQPDHLLFARAFLYHLYRHTQSAFAFNFRLRTATAQQASQHAGESHRAQKRSMGAETIHGHASVPRASASRPPKAGSVPRTVRSRPRHPHATQAASKPTHAALPQPACCPSIGARRTQKRLATGAGSLPSVALTQARDASHRHFKKNLQSAWLLLILCCSMQ